LPSRRKFSAITGACAMVGAALGRRLHKACAPKSRNAF
jgi:hypothetical protein